MNERDLLIEEVSKHIKTESISITITSIEKRKKTLNI